MNPIRFVRRRYVTAKRQSKQGRIRSFDATFFVLRSVDVLNRPLPLVSIRWPTPIRCPCDFDRYSTKPSESNSPANRHRAVRRHLSVVRRAMIYERRQYLTWVRPKLSQDGRGVQGNIAVGGVNSCLTVYKGVYYRAAVSKGAWRGN